MTIVFAIVVPLRVVPVVRIDGKRILSRIVGSFFNKQVVQRYLAVDTKHVANPRRVKQHIRHLYRHAQKCNTNNVKLNTYLFKAIRNRWGLLEEA